MNNNNNNYYYYYYHYHHEISTMWETKPRMNPQRTSRLLIGLEQLTRP